MDDLALGRDPSTLAGREQPRGLPNPSAGLLVTAQVLTRTQIGQAPAVSNQAGGQPRRAGRDDDRHRQPCVDGDRATERGERGTGERVDVADRQAGAMAQPPGAGQTEPG